MHGASSPPLYNERIEEMMNIQRILSLVTLSAALGCGIIAGVFFAFSSFVMPALARLPAAQGIAAMQSINIVVLNRSFLGVFSGTALVCVVLAIAPLFRWSGLAAGMSISGSLLYIVGTFGVTVVFNVPRNDALAVLNPDVPGAAAMWQAYVSSWTFWNTVRCLSALAAAGAFTVALIERARVFGGLAWFGR
jgi:uncharacterized membrane protein